VTDEPFSVLLPVYSRDRPDFLTRAFVSATAEQTLPPDEVVVVVDGPVGSRLRSVIDGLSATSASKVILVELPENRGLARALDVGLDHCTHEIVARADADDVNLCGRFAAQVPLVRSGIDLLGSAIVEFTENEAEWGAVRTPPLDSNSIVSYARFHDPFNHPSVVCRKSAVAAAGGYRALDLLEDYWLFARMIANGAVVGNVAEPLVLYRIGAGSYARRGGMRLLRSELALQNQLRREGFTSSTQYARNVALRGGYRLVPERLRTAAYRRLILRRGRGPHPQPRDPSRS
jgi:glycosyltransferase involved in cell wall biosynthesis